MRVRTTWSADEWDELVRGSRNGTLLHTRRYLEHQGDRFADRSVLVESDSGPVAVFPAARHPQRPEVVVSHPGLTYGGLVTAPNVGVPDVAEAMAAVVGHFAQEGVSEVIYKQVPRLYHRVPNDDDSFALVRLGASPQRCDVSVSVDLRTPPRISSTRRNTARRAAREGARVCEGVEHLEAFWQVLQEVLAERHDAEPVHTLAEMAQLQSAFPDDVRCFVVLGPDDTVVGGAVVYVAGQAWHTQYMAAGAAGRRVWALDLLLSELIGIGQAAGAAWLDFGTSMEDSGRRLNTGLHNFKLSFGGQTHAYLHWRLAVSAPG